MITQRNTGNIIQCEKGRIRLRASHKKSSESSHRRPPLRPPRRSQFIDNQKIALSSFPLLTPVICGKTLGCQNSPLVHSQFNKPYALISRAMSRNLSIPGTYHFREYGIWTYRDPPFWLAIRGSIRKFGEIWPALLELFKLVASKSGWWFLLLLSVNAMQELVQGIRLHLDVILVKEARYTNLCMD